MELRQKKKTMTPSKLRNVLLASLNVLLASLNVLLASIKDMAEKENFLAS